MIEHADAAHAAAAVGAAAAALFLLGRARVVVLAGLGAFALAEALLLFSIVPGDDLERLVDSPARIALVVVLVLVLVGVGVLLARYPAVLPVLALIAAPFRVPIRLGDQDAFLLVPLYAVIAAGALALLLMLLRGGDPPELPMLLALPAALYIGLAALSLYWTDDLRSGTIELLFFLFPFAVLVGAIGRLSLAWWHARALATALTALAVVFAVIGLWQLWSERLFFARDLEVANAYTTFFRTTSLFADSSLYGRVLVVAIVVLLVAVWLARVNLWLCAALMACLWTGLYFSYSQSSMVALIVSVLGLGLVQAGRRGRIALAAGAGAIVVAAAAFVAAVGRDEPLQRFTSGRSGLVESTARVFVEHPLVGVGVGGQPRASREEGGRRKIERNASHTTPLTVAAELGVLGLVVYLALLASAARLLVLVVRLDRALGLGLAFAFLALFVHSLFYSGFFEDPLTWGILAVAGAALAARRESLAEPQAVRTTTTPIAGSEPTTSP